MTDITLPRELVERLVHALDPSDGGTPALVSALRSALTQQAEREGPQPAPKDSGSTRRIKVEPGSDLHMQMLMTPWHLQMLMGDELRHVMEFGRLVWKTATEHAATQAQAGQPADEAHEIQFVTSAQLPPAAKDSATRLAKLLMDAFGLRHKAIADLATVVLSFPATQAQAEPVVEDTHDEDEYVIHRMGQLLAEIAIAIKGPEPARRRWGYTDLPERVRELVGFRQAVLDPENQPSQFGTVLYTGPFPPPFCMACGSFDCEGGCPSRECELPPPGWRCTRKPGHEGPCAAVACPDELDFVARGMDRLRASESPAQEAQAPSAPVGDGWRPIETAPKDGTEIVIMRAGKAQAFVARWDEYPGNPVVSAGGSDTWMYGWVFRDLLLDAKGCDEGFLGWDEDAGVMPTHWMPYPGAARAAQAEDGNHA